MAKYLTAFLLFIMSLCAHAVITLEQAKESSQVIGRWIAKTTGHYDFLSATPVATKRAGTKFMITIAPDIQTASDYGFSYMLAPRDREVTKAYETLGVDTKSMAKNLELNRFHINLGANNKYDFTFSYLFTLGRTLRGYGLGYKQVLFQNGPLYFSYRLQYAKSQRDDFYQAQSLTNDLSVSLYLRLLDVYTGVRHGMGKVRFHSSIPELQLPEAKYISNADQLELFYGLVLATTTHSRFTFQCTRIGKELTYAGKLTMHFDSLFPAGSGWFRDPRYIKQ